MKKYLLGAVLCCSAFAVSASPTSFPIVNFAFDGGTMEVVNANGIGFSIYNANSGSAMLGVGERQNFTFGTASFVGRAEGKVKFGVSFVDPILENIEKTRKFDVWSWGIFSGGELKGGSKSFDYSYGDYEGVAKLKFDGFDIDSQWGHNFAITGSIKNVSMVRVPEPASVALFGLGIMGLAFARRKRAS